MRWVIENNVANEELYDSFISSIERAGITYDIVKKIPFSEEIDPDIDIDGDVVVYGSTSLCFKVAPKKGWKVFQNSNFDYEVWSEKWEGNILNEKSETEVGPFQSVPINHEEFFIRPCKDNKVFSGLVCSIEHYLHWREQIELAIDSSEYVHFDLNEPVTISPLKNIQKEIRFFVVDGKIATHSIYKTRSRVMYQEEKYTDPEAIEFVNNMIDIWKPADAFVLDVALIESGFKIIEINCINSAGLYKCDTNKLVGAFLEYFNKEN